MTGPQLVPQHPGQDPDDDVLVAGPELLKPAVKQKEPKKATPEELAAEAEIYQRLKALGYS